MTDLREALGALFENEPEATLIDPHAAVRASRSRGRRRRAWLASGAAALVVVAGAAATVPRLDQGDTSRVLPGPADQPSASPTSTVFDPGSITCDRDSDWVAKVTHLPTDVAPITAAYLCEVVDRTVPGDGTWLYQVVREVTGSLPALEEALAAPDASGNDGDCTLQFDIGRPIWVVGQRSALVRVPLDGCGHAVSEATDVLDQLPTKVISEKRLRQTQSQTALDSGCSQDFTDMLREEASDRQAPDVKPPPQLDPSMRWTVCRYDVINQDGGTLGWLHSATRLSPQQVARLNAALAAARVDPSCRRDDHTRFATVIDRDGSNYWLDIALDGCAVQRGSDWWRADSEVRRILDP